MKKYLIIALITLPFAIVVLFAFLNPDKKNVPQNPTTSEEPASLSEGSSNQPTAPPDPTVGMSNDSTNNRYLGGKRNSKKAYSSNSNTTQVISTPEYTLELRNGQPLEEFPFEIMTEPPHSLHDPVTDFASVVNDPAGTYLFTLPETTSSLGLYGRFWISPSPPSPSAKLSGVRFINSSWTGTTDDSVVVFSLLDKQTEDNALGTVTGTYQGLANQLVAVLFETSISKIELKLNEPILNSGERFVLAIDSENLPTGNPDIIFPDTIAVEQIQWLWTI